MLVALAPAPSDASLACWRDALRVAVGAWRFGLPPAAFTQPETLQQTQAYCAGLYAWLVGAAFANAVPGLAWATQLQQWQPALVALVAVAAPPHPLAAVQSALALQHLEIRGWPLPVGAAFRLRAAMANSASPSSRQLAMFNVTELHVRAAQLAAAIYEPYLANGWLAEYNAAMLPQVNALVGKLRDHHRCTAQPLTQTTLSGLLAAQGTWQGGPLPDYEESVRQHDLLGLPRPPLVLVPRGVRPGASLGLSGAPATPHLITKEGRYATACLAHSLRCRPCDLALSPSYTSTSICGGARSRRDFDADCLEQIHLRVSQRLVVSLAWLRWSDAQILHMTATYESLAKMLTDGAPVSDALRKSEVNDALQVYWLIKYARLMREHFETADGHLSITFEKGEDFIDVGILAQYAILDKHGFYFDMDGDGHTRCCRGELPRACWVLDGNAKLVFVKCAALNCLMPPRRGQVMCAAHLPPEQRTLSVAPTAPAAASASAAATAAPRAAAAAAALGVAVAPAAHVQAAVLMSAAAVAGTPHAVTAFVGEPTTCAPTAALAAAAAAPSASAAAAADARAGLAAGALAAGAAAADAEGLGEGESDESEGDEDEDTGRHASLRHEGEPTPQQLAHLERRTARARHVAAEREREEVAAALAAKELTRPQADAELAAIAACAKQAKREITGGLFFNTCHCGIINHLSIIMKGESMAAIATSLLDLYAAAKVKPCVIVFDCADLLLLWMLRNLSTEQLKIFADLILLLDKFHSPHKNLFAMLFNEPRLQCHREMIAGVNTARAETTNYIIGQAKKQFSKMTHPRSLGWMINFVHMHNEQHIKNLDNERARAERIAKARKSRDRDATDVAGAPPPPPPLPSDQAIDTSDEEDAFVPPPGLLPEQAAAKRAEFEQAVLAYKARARAHGRCFPGGCVPEHARIGACVPCEYARELVGRPVVLTLTPLTVKKSNSSVVIQATGASTFIETSGDRFVRDVIAYAFKPQSREEAEIEDDRLRSGASALADVATGSVTTASSAPASFRFDPADPRPIPPSAPAAQRRPSARIAARAPVDGGGRAPAEIVPRWVMYLEIEWKRSAAGTSYGTTLVELTWLRRCKPARVEAFLDAAATAMGFAAGARPTLWPAAWRKRAPAAPSAGRELNRAAVAHAAAVATRAATLAPGDDAAEARLAARAGPRHADAE